MREPGLTIEDLDQRTIERAGALVASEHTAARASRLELPGWYANAHACAEALESLMRGGHRVLVARHRDRVLAVIAAIVREVRVVGRYARLPAEGFAVDPALDDPTTVLAILFGQLASELVDDGVRRYYLLHVASTGALPESLANLGFARDGVYAVQRVAPRPVNSGVVVREALPDELDIVARLALVEVEHRANPPMFAPTGTPVVADLLTQHRAVRDGGAVHLLGRLDGRDVGLLTVEPNSPAPRLCPAGQPYIGATATVPDARGRGVGRALVDTALNWAHEHGYEWIGVDFNSANPLSRPFWLGTGFRPTGYGLMRLIDPEHAPASGVPSGRAARISRSGKEPR